MKNNFENINDLQYMKDFFLSKAKSYTTFSILSKYSNQAFILDMVIQIFFKYETTFQMSYLRNTDCMQGTDLNENQKDMLMMCLYFNEIKDSSKMNEHSKQEINLGNGFDVEIINSLKNKLDDGKPFLNDICAKMQENINNELKIQMENLSKFLTNKDENNSLHLNIINFIKFILKIQTFMHLTTLTDNSFPYLGFVENIFKTLNSLTDLQKTHGNILNMMDFRPCYRGLLISYYHFLNNSKKSLNFLGSLDLQQKFTEKMTNCFNVISNYHSDQRKMTEEDIIWPFEFLLEKHLSKQNSEFFFLQSLEKMHENQHFDSKRLLQKSILMDPSKIKYRETYFALATLVGKTFVKNQKMLNFSKENNLSFLIKVIQESLSSSDRLKVFSKIMIYYPTIDVFYVFCRCWFEKNNCLDKNAYVRLTGFIKIYLKKESNGKTKKWINKLLKLYLQIIIHFQMVLRDKKILNYEHEKLTFENMLNEDLKFVINHGQYKENEKIQGFHKRLEAFYSFDEKNFALEKVLQVFNGINDIEKKVSFLLVI